MPKVSKKQLRFEDEETDEDCDFTVKEVPQKVAPVLPTPILCNKTSFSIYKSASNRFADDKNIPYCPDCPPSARGTMINKNGIFVCPDKHRCSITVKAVSAIIENNYINNQYVFPICDTCQRSLMAVVGNPDSKFSGMLYFTCSCDAELYVMCHKNSGTINNHEKVNKIVTSFSPEYIANHGELKKKTKFAATAKKIYSTKI